MKIDILIPTLNRTEKLKTCVDSVVKAVYNDVRNEYFIYVYFSRQVDLDNFYNKYGTENIILKLLEKEYRSPVFWNDWLKDMDSEDALVYINDDIIMDIDCLRLAALYLKEAFKNDGVVGFYQENLTAVTETVKTAFGMVGGKFAKRFPNNQVFCPDYHRFFIDKELELYSSSIGKLYTNRCINLKHLHPIVNKTYEDNTHFEVRKHLQQDKDTWNKRLKKGLLWGRSFERITADSQ